MTWSPGPSKQEQELQTGFRLRTHWESSTGEATIVQMERLKKYFVVILFITLPMGYTLWDMRQAKHMAADACSKVVKGMNLEDYLSALPQKEYRIIVNDRSVFWFPEEAWGVISA
jgi:hypothetical protein